MISRVAIQNFKRFKDRTEFLLKPEGITFLAGGNNSGKSTLLQALAVWEFARSVIAINKSNAALLAGTTGHGVGVSTEEFSPIALPNLKHLWSGLKVLNNTTGNGYNLRIRCEWPTTGDPSTHHLEFGFALSNDRLFLKTTSSNLRSEDAIPRMAYLPPFAGITPREERMSPATRRRWMGRGLAGAVLRNLLYDFWEKNDVARKQAKAPNGKIPKAALAELRKMDSWEQLLNVLEEVFKTGLSVKQFNELYHTTIEVAAWEGQLVNKRFRRKAKTPEKDLMVEGGGFLQWLSVYALALNKELDVLLLDEPDAHLHPALQGYLIHKLAQLARENRKQVLLATHSTTILMETKVEQIFRMEDRDYLKDERGRVALFVGLGSQYAPRLDQLKRCKRLFLHDGPSNVEILRTWATKLGIEWPQVLVDWIYSRDGEARKALVSELRKDIPDLKAISLEDRDDYPFSETKSDLTYGSMQAFYSGLGLRRWRRRNIESYLLHPDAIARAAAKPVEEVRQFLETVHGLSVTANFKDSNCPQTLAHTDGKEIITKNPRSVTAEFGIDYRKIAESMLPDEIPDDVKTLLRELTEMCRS